MSNGDFIKNIINKLEEMQEKLPHEMTSKFSSDTMVFYKSLIGAFYSEYPKPSSYHRHTEGNFYDLLINMKHGSSNAIGKSFASFEISSSNLYGNYRIEHSRIEGSSKDNLFDMFWNKGLRGLPESGSTPMSNGEYWHNPYWGEKYHNEFIPENNKKVKFNNTKIKGKTPSEAMMNFYKRWSHISGSSYCMSIVKKYF